MSAAITTSVSQISNCDTGAVETGSPRSEHDRSKTPVWVPELTDYGDLPLLVGLDSEWQNEGASNRVLSYQFFAFDFAGQDWCGIYYPQPNTRYGLSALVSCVVMEGLKQGRIKRWPTKVYLIAHFSLADLTTLTSFAKMKTLVDSVRRTFVSLSGLLSVKLWDANRHCHEVSVIVRDSMLLAPAGKQAPIIARMLGRRAKELRESIFAGTSAHRFDE